MISLPDKQIIRSQINSTGTVQVDVDLIDILIFNYNPFRLSIDVQSNFNLSVKYSLHMQLTIIVCG